MAGVFLDRYYQNSELKHVYPAEDLARLVKDSVDYYIKEARDAREQAQQTREEVKQSVVNEYADENDRLRRKLKYCVATLYSDTELERYNQFCNEHAKCLSGHRTNWGKVPFVRQEGVGFGTSTTVVCQVCGATRDITDTTAW